MNFKVFILSLGLFLVGGAIGSLPAAPQMEIGQSQANLTNQILKAASVQFQDLGYDYTYEFLHREYQLGNVTIEELGAYEYRVTVGGGDIAIVIMEEM